MFGPLPDRIAPGPEYRAKIPASTRSNTEAGRELRWNGTEVWYESTVLKNKSCDRLFRRTFHLSLAAQRGQLYSRAIAVLNLYEPRRNRDFSQRGWCSMRCGAGVSPAFLGCTKAAKIAGETPTPRNAARGVASPGCLARIKVVVGKRL